MTTLTIMRHLPREVDPLVYNMSHEDPGDVTYSAIGGLAEQIRELREVMICYIFFLETISICSQVSRLVGSWVKITLLTSSRNVHAYNCNMI